MKHYATIEGRRLSHLGFITICRRHGIMKVFIYSFFLCLPLALLCAESLTLTAAAAVYLAALYWASSHTAAGRRFARHLWREAVRLIGPME